MNERMDERIERPAHETPSAEMKGKKWGRARFRANLPIREGGPLNKIPIMYYAARIEDVSRLGCLECARAIREPRAKEGRKMFSD